ncbi:MAG TPA: MSMEG_0565 family glycosyltransferase [Polyangia bacterium]|nr:MSMEG_0565 family glycosyltransferase [Polyangia bacterium]
MSHQSVGIFTYSTVPRGSVVHAAALADALTEAGWDATLYALHKDGRGFFRPLRARLRLVPAAPAPPTTAALVRQRAGELTDFLAAAGADHDVLHAQDCLSASGLLAAREAGVIHAPIARTVHHLEAFADAELSRCQNRSIRDVDFRFAVSRTTRHEVAAAFGFSCHLVGNGVDVDRLRLLDPERLAFWRTRLAGARPLVLAVGGVEPRKNSLRALQAFACFHARRPDARLWIAGGASALDHSAYRAAYDGALAELPPATRDAIVELGVLPEADLVALFALADVAMLPSLDEGFGLVALEALAAGVPLVASNRAPFTEFLDGGCATLVDPMSAEAIAAGLEQALAAPPARITAGRRRAESLSWSRVAAATIDGYERVLGHAGNALRHSLA